MNTNNRKTNHKKSVGALEVIRYTSKLFKQKLSTFLRNFNDYIGPHWTDRLRQYGLLMRVDKPIGTLLLLWPTMWALWLASPQFPNVVNIVIFTLGVFLMRSAGCVINDYADREIDGNVARTKLRPMARGQVSEKEALLLFIVLALLALARY